MGLRDEIREELEERAFKEGEKRIVEKYYADPDAEMRGIGASILHSKFVGEHELTPEQKRMMELELENYRLKYGHSSD